MVRLSIIFAISVALWSALAITSTQSHAATIEATVDRTVMQENESLTLTLSSDSDVDDDPDLSALEKDFQIVDRKQSSNIVFINNRVNRRFEWELMLVPKRTGNLQIPRIAFGKDQSNAISIKVTPASAGGSSISDELMYIEASVDDDTIYVQSQVVYTLRIYHAVQLRTGSLTELAVSDRDAVIEKLSENRSYKKMINGRSYRVFEKQFAIFPQTAGDMVIEPVVLEAQYIDAPRVLRTKRLVSKPIKVTVQAVPNKARQPQTTYWLPARSLTLTEKWSSNAKEIKVGDPITRTLTLTAKGLMSSQLPVLTDTDARSDLKHYADQPVLDNTVDDQGFVGKREEKIAYIPTQAGELKLPAVKVTWWNMEKDRLETSTLPGRTLKVVAVVGQAAQTTGQFPQETTGNAEQEITENNIMPATDVTSVGGMSSQVWFGISVAMFIIWIVTIATWYLTARRRARHPVTATVTERHQQSSKDVLKQVKNACDANNPQQVKSALIKWGQQQWPEQPPTSLGHIAQRVKGDLAVELQQLNDLLYKPGGAPWNSNGLWQSLKQYVEENNQQTSQARTAIPPLYRIALVNDDQ
jgi:hypothetical protein